MIKKLAAIEIYITVILMGGDVYMLPRKGKKSNQ